MAKPTLAKPTLANFSVLVFWPRPEPQTLQTQNLHTERGARHFGAHPSGPHPSGHTSSGFGLAPPFLAVLVLLWVKYKFIKTTFIKKSSFIKIHFHQKPISSKSRFIKKQVHQKTGSSKNRFIKTTFIKNHFHQKPLASKTNFIRDHFHQKPLPVVWPTISGQNQLWPRLTLGSLRPSCETPKATRPTSLGSGFLSPRILSPGLSPPWKSNLASKGALNCGPECKNAWVLTFMCLVCKPNVAWSWKQQNYNHYSCRREKNTSIPFPFGEKHNYHHSFLCRTFFLGSDCNHFHFFKQKTTKPSPFVLKTKQQPCFLLLETPPPRSFVGETTQLPSFLTKQHHHCHFSGWTKQRHHHSSYWRKHYFHHSS